MKMIPQYPFPNQYDVIREEAERFQKLSSRERMALISDMMRHGTKLIELSPHREKILALQEMEEKAWRDAHTKVFAAYEAKHGSLSR